MKYQATISFTGVVSMAVGDVKELDSSIAENLVKVGYLVPLGKAEKAEPVEEVKEKKKSPKRKESKTNDN